MPIMHRLRDKFCFAFIVIIFATQCWAPVDEPVTEDGDYGCCESGYTCVSNYGCQKSLGTTTYSWILFLSNTAGTIYRQYSSSYSRFCAKACLSSETVTQCCGSGGTKCTYNCATDDAWYHGDYTGVSAYGYCNAGYYMSGSAYTSGNSCTSCPSSGTSPSSNTSGITSCYITDSGGTDTKGTYPSSTCYYQ